MKTTFNKSSRRKAGYKFVNYTGAGIKFCTSNKDLNEDLNFNSGHVYSLRRLSNLKRAHDKMSDYLVEMPGSENNVEYIAVEFRDIKFFQK